MMNGTSAVVCKLLSIAISFKRGQKIVYLAYTRSQIIAVISLLEYLVGSALPSFVCSSQRPTRGCPAASATLAGQGDGRGTHHGLAWKEPTAAPTHRSVRCCSVAPWNWSNKRGWDGSLNYIARCHACTPGKSSSA
eukprot:GHVT01042377.1.p1 GENE.GHVT01042377.1~~GHVT01042377.1.p1  ORF type:complete len:136 (+),score=14.95 GHVT01042377.1:449-856(+)